MSVELLTEHPLEFLSLKGGFTGSSESTLVKLPHCWKSHVAAKICFNSLAHMERSSGNAIIEPLQDKTNSDQPGHLLKQLIQIRRCPHEGTLFL